MRSQETHMGPHELAGLPASARQLASGDPDQRILWQHLQQCATCTTLVEQHWALLQSTRVPSAEQVMQNCPAKAIWPRYLAGELPDRATELLLHVGECDRCAFELREAMEAIAPGQSVTPDTDAARFERIAANAIKPAPAASLPFVPRRSSTLIWIRLSGIAAALALAVGLGFALWQQVHPSESRLLAAAYNKQRTMSLRIPGSQPVPMASITRSGLDATHGLSEPAELIELHLRAQQHLDRQPNSPYWHQVLGEIELQQQDGQAARRNFEIAQTTDAALPNLLPDLAAAWFQIGQSTGNTVDYAQASELYLQELRSTQDGKDRRSEAPLLHYNLAICFEKQNLVDNALQELKDALSEEKDQDWRKTIQAEIARLMNQGSNDSTGDTLERDGYESALTNAVQNLLPQGPSATNEKKLKEVAAIGAQHHDKWLLEWMNSAHTPVSQQADTHLSLATGASTRGDAESILREAALALALYRQSHIVTGQLRAQYAQVYAYQRLGRDKDCVSASTDMLRSPSIRSYSLLLARALTDKSICETRDGRFADADKDAHLAMSLVTVAHLPKLRLYILSLRAATLNYQGRPAAAWQVGTDSLKLCAIAQCGRSGQYPVVYYLVRNALDLQLPRTANALMQAAVFMAQTSSDKVTRAYAQETLGLVAGRVGNFKSSDEAFANAHAVANDGRSSLSQIYQAEWLVDQAEVRSTQGQSQQALQLLQQSKSVIASSEYVPGQLKFYRQSSRAELALHRYDDALAHAQAAVSLSETSLVGLNSVIKKEHWLREDAPVYAQLIKVYLALGDKSQAVQSWERYRSAPYRNEALPTDSPTRSSQPRNKTGRPVLVLALVDDTYVGWLVDPVTMEAVMSTALGDRESIQRDATTFYRLCSDRNSSIADIHVLGAALYRELLAPFIPQLAPNGKLLQVDLDPSISMLPLAALTAPDGGWLGDEYSVVVGAAWWSLAPPSTAAPPTVDPNSDLLIANGFASDADSEVPQMGRLFRRSKLLTAGRYPPSALVASLSSAAVFHFTGHSTASGGGLSLANAAVFRPEDIDGLHLPNLRLAFLAACDTSGADPDQLELLPNMRNAFLRAGAQAVIASQWDVDDRSTDALSSTFYRHLIAGASLTQSLVEAQRKVRSNAAWQHPYFWAPFQVFTNHLA